MKPRNKSKRLRGTMARRNVAMLTTITTMKTTAINWAETVERGAKSVEYAVHGAIKQSSRRRLYDRAERAGRITSTTTETMSLAMTTLWRNKGRRHATTAPRRRLITGANRISHATDRTYGPDVVHQRRTVNRAAAQRPGVSEAAVE